MAGLEQKYRVPEVARAMGLSPETVRRMFLKERGVLVLGNQKSVRGRRPHRTLLIPQSVLERVQRQMENG